MRALTLTIRLLRIWATICGSSTRTGFPTWLLPLALYLVQFTQILSRVTLIATTWQVLPGDDRESRSSSHGPDALW